MKTTIRSLPGLGAYSRRLAAVFIIGSILVGTAARASERWETLQAIHMLENPGDSHCPGSQGELGAYQFREETWKMYTQAPFSRALDRRSSDAVAVKYYDWIKGELEKRGVTVTPYSVALAWNGGIKAVTAGHPPASALDYASRAANLAADIGRGRLADTR
jgi:hypothetical protein